MSVIDDIKAKLSILARDGKGIDIDDLKQAASEYGVDPSVFRDIDERSLGPNGRLSLDDALQLVDEHLGSSGGAVPGYTDKKK